MVNMCMLGDVVATRKTAWSMGDRHLDNCKTQLAPFRGLLAFLPVLRLGDRMKTPKLLTNGI